MGFSWVSLLITTLLNGFLWELRQTSNDYLKLVMNEIPHTVSMVIGTEPKSFPI